MKIENNILNLGFDHCSDIMIYPKNYHYSEYKISLTEDQKNQAKEEDQLIKKILNIPEIKEALYAQDNEEVTINEQVKAIELAREKLIENKLPLSVLDNFFLEPEIYENNICMKPNTDFPLTSVWSLTNFKNSVLYQSNNKVMSQLWCEEDKIRTKLIQLESCKDDDFILSSIKPMQDRIKQLEKNNPNEVKKIKKNEEFFMSYLRHINLEKEFLEFEESIEPKIPKIKSKKLKP